MYRLRTLLVLPTALLIGALVFAACSSGEESDAGAGAGDGAPAAAASESEGSAAKPAVGGGGLQQQFQQTVELSVTFTSPVFNAKRRIPKKATCIGGKVDRSGQSDKAGEMFARGNLTGSDAQNLSPPLDWADVPEGTQSFAVIVHSTESQASDEAWIHWVIWEPAGRPDRARRGHQGGRNAGERRTPGTEQRRRGRISGAMSAAPHQQARVRSRRRLQPQAGDREVQLRGLRPGRDARPRARRDPTTAPGGDGGPHPGRRRADRRASGAAEAAALAGRRLS